MSKQKKNMIVTNLQPCVLMLSRVKLCPMIEKQRHKMNSELTQHYFVTFSKH